MTILNWIRRRTKSHYADDKTVDDFARVAKSRGAPLDYERSERLTELMEDPENLEEIAKLLGQSET